MARRDGSGRGETRGVRALERGLAVLAAMNRHKVASVVELARETRLPRPTVYRLLETLGRAGFVTRSGSADRFCLARRVRSLSDGFVDDEWITTIAAPLMAAFTATHVWPVALMTFEEGRMLIRETTHPASSLSIDYGMVGRRLPMLRTAAGRAYLAFCPENERRAILDMLGHSSALEDRYEERRLPGMLRDIRSTGCALQDREINPKTSGISVPIRGERLLGCVSMIWIASALTMEEAQQRFLAPLLALASRIAGEVDERRSSGASRRSGNRSAPPETGLRQLGKIRGSQSETAGNSVNKPSSTRSAAMNGVTPR
jgi:IclR family transcriptional regulator, mhp operon transcriptional activator